MFIEITIENINQLDSKQGGFLSFNDLLIVRELLKRGVFIKADFSEAVMIAQHNGQQKVFANYLYGLNSDNTQIFNDKYKANLLVNNTTDIPCLQQTVVGPNQKNKVLDFSNKVSYPIVIKPSDSASGDCVFPLLANEKELLRAYHFLEEKTDNPNILLQEYYKGDDCRILLIGDTCYSAIKRTPPVIIGDGVHTVKELIEKENYRRLNPRSTCLGPIRFYDSTQDDSMNIKFPELSWESNRVLTHQGFNAHSIPKLGETVIIRYNSNVSWGAEVQTITQDIHPFYVDQARKIQKLLPTPSSSVIAIDFLIKQYDKKPSEGGYCFLELESTPGFSMHVMPSKGQSDPVIEQIADIIFPNNGNAYDTKNQWLGHVFEQCTFPKTEKELNNINRDLESVKERWIKGAYQQTDFIARNTFDVPRRTQEFFSYFESYLAQSKEWEEQLRKLPIDTFNCILHILPGWSPKVEWALARADFAREIHCIDKNASHLLQLEQMADLFPRQFAIKSIQKNIFDYHPTFKYDCLIGNHILDDLIFEQYAVKMNIPLSKVYESEVFYQQLVKAVLLDISLSQTLAEQLAVKLDFLLSKDGFILLKHYESLMEKLLPIPDWSHYMNELLNKLRLCLSQRGFQWIQKGSYITVKRRLA